MCLSVQEQIRWGCSKPPEPRGKIVNIKSPFHSSSFHSFLCVVIMDRSINMRPKRYGTEVLYFIWSWIDLNKVEINQKTANSKKIPTGFSFFLNKNVQRVESLSCVMQYRSYGPINQKGTGCLGKANISSLTWSRWDAAKGATGTARLPGQSACRPVSDRGLRTAPVLASSWSWADSYTKGAL